MFAFCNKDRFLRALFGAFKMYFGNISNHGLENTFFETRFDSFSVSKFILRFWSLAVYIGIAVLFNHQVQLLITE